MTMRARDRKTIKEEVMKTLTSSPKTSRAIDRMLGIIPEGKEELLEEITIMWEQLGGMKERVSLITEKLPYHSGSKLSQVVDLLGQAVSLCGESVEVLKGEEVEGPETSPTL